MGYSSRYHAASLAAVFLALAIGILIGVGFGDNVLSSTKRDLEASLTGDLEAARGRSDQLATQLNRSDEFAQRVYPVLVRGELRGQRIAVVALGGLPEDLSGAIEDALQPTGARLVAVAVVREPPDLGRLAEMLSSTRLFDLETNSDSLDLDPEEKTATGRLESGLLDGIVAAGAKAVGVETTETDPSSISALSSHDLSTVDDLDLVSGQVAMVFALRGAEGNFGVKDTADRLLPDLLTPSPRLRTARPGER
jgi:hypothetical protein